jgi:hypothetical protein
MEYARWACLEWQKKGRKKGEKRTKKNGIDLPFFLFCDEI